MVAGRMHQYGPKDLAQKVPHGIDHELGRLFYDIAGSTSRPAIAALTSLVPATQILFGSDNPYIPLEETVNGLARLELSTADLRAIARDNALSLLKRFEKQSLVQIS
jgi:predicted TIM-barrel fold metal-dependent hydrolase